MYAMRRTRGKSRIQDQAKPSITYQQEHPDLHQRPRDAQATKPKENHMSNKIKEILEKLEEAKRTIREQQKEIDRLNKLIEILKKYGDADE